MTVWLRRLFITGFASSLMMIPLVWSLCRAAALGCDDEEWEIQDED